jgi:hypothetical protein
MLLLARTTPLDQVKKGRRPFGFLVDISPGWGMGRPPLPAMINHNTTEVF